MKQTRVCECWTPRVTRLAHGISLDPVVQSEFGLDTIHELRWMSRHRSLMSNLWSEIKRLIPLFHSSQNQDQKLDNCIHLYTWLHLRFYVFLPRNSFLQFAISSQLSSYCPIPSHWVFQILFCCYYFFYFSSFFLPPSLASWGKGTEALILLSES